MMHGTSCPKKNKARTTNISAQHTNVCLLTTSPASATSSSLFVSPVFSSDPVRRLPPKLVLLSVLTLVHSSPTSSTVPVAPVKRYTRASLFWSFSTVFTATSTLFTPRRRLTWSHYLEHSLTRHIESHLRCIDLYASSRMSSWRSSPSSCLVTSPAPSRSLSSA